MVIRGVISEEFYEKKTKRLKDDSPFCEFLEWWDNIRYKPFLLHVDNGKYFMSEDFDKWLNSFNHPIHKAVRPVDGSQYGGMVERHFKTIQQASVHKLQGNQRL